MLNFSPRENASMYHPGKIYSADVRGGLILTGDNDKDRVASHPVAGLHFISCIQVTVLVTKWV